MTSATVSQFKQLFPATATSSKVISDKVPIKLKLKNKWDSETLQDLTELVKFDVLCSNLHLSKVEKGCIAVIWLCSTTEVKQLKMAILATGSLQTMGVLQVFIGEELVLECSHSTTGIVCASLWRSSYCGMMMYSSDVVMVICNCNQLQLITKF